MVITRTPLRVSLAGGGSDLPAFYSENGGAVVSLAIDLSMYVAVHERVAQSGYRVAYSRVEEVETLEEIQHGIVRHALSYLEPGPCEIATICDVPAGTGLGSSGAVAVGLMNALDPGHRPAVVARAAWAIEALALGHQPGVQDHVSAAFGDLRLYEFMADVMTASEPLLDHDALLDLCSRLWLVPTGGTRDSEAILTTISAEACEEPTQSVLGLLRDVAYALATSLREGKGGSAVREALLTGWALKRELTGVSSPTVDSLYARACESGAEAGKLLGAGGEGFLLLYVEPEHKLSFLAELPEALPVIPSLVGSEVIYSG